MCVCLSGDEVVSDTNVTSSPHTVSAPTGKKVISGGYHWRGYGQTAPTGVSMLGSHPASDQSGWIFEFIDNTGYGFDLYAVVVDDD